MNIYQKLADVRVKLLNLGMKKGGTNEHMCRRYFELDDFMPDLMTLERDNGLCSFVSFNTDLATLTIVNADEPTECIEVCSPMSSADLPKVHAVQNLGAVQTYLRRYLYMAALNITEGDALDASIGKPVPVASKVSTSPDIITTAQLKELVAMCGPDTLPDIVARRKALSDIRERKGYAKASQIEVKDLDAITEELCIALANMEVKA